MGKISYEDKARIETLRKFGLDTEQLLENFRKRVGIPTLLRKIVQQFAQ